MKRILLAAIALLLATFSRAQAASTAQAEVASAHYLIGTWACAHTVGTFSGTYTTTYANALDNVWIRQTIEFPASQFNGTPQPAVRAEWIMGYDERRQVWVRFGTLTNGDYFIIRMTDTPDGWSWKYVSLTPRRTPETPGSDATFTKKSDVEYVVDGPTYDQNGTSVTEHHDCKKQ
jgi:hypothetical protein